MLSVSSKPGENLGKVCENSRVGENPRCNLIFHWSAFKFYQMFASVSPGYEGVVNMFYYLNPNQ